MKFYQVVYTIFETRTRDTYIYAMNEESARAVFEKSAADLGFMSIDFEITHVFELSHIEESIVMQGAYYEARENQCNS